MIFSSSICLPKLSQFHFALELYSVPEFIFIMSFLSFHQLKNPQFVSIPELLWILQWWDEQIVLIFYFRDDPSPILYLYSSSFVILFTYFVCMFILIFFFCSLILILFFEFLTYWSFKKLLVKILSLLCASCISVNVSILCFEIVSSLILLKIWYMSLTCTFPPSSMLLI